jgi:hypothetical protein
MIDPEPYEDVAWPLVHTSSAPNLSGRVAVLKIGLSKVYARGQSETVEECRFLFIRSAQSQTDRNADVFYIFVNIY